jgi:hypothetical protein
MALPGCHPIPPSSQEAQHPLQRKAHGPKPQPDPPTAGTGPTFSAPWRVPPRQSEWWPGGSEGGSAKFELLIIRQHLAPQVYLCMVGQVI